ncbi:MAG TPA: hypothetical protein VGF27_08850 [Pseudoduganella sp.]
MLIPMRKPRLASLGGIACLSLAACSGDGPQSNMVLEGSPAAVQSAALLVSGDPLGGYGEAFTDSEGRGFIVVGPDDGQGAQALYRLDGGTIRRTPGELPGAVMLNQASSMKLRTSAVTLPQLAGNYTIRFGGDGADFRLDADGRLTAAGGGCQLSGTLRTESSVQGTLPLTLTIAGCALAGSYEGYAIRPLDYQPAAFRLVADDGKRVLDGYAVSYR